MELLGRGREADVYALDEQTCIKLFAAGHAEHLIRKEGQRLQFVCGKGVPAPQFFGFAQQDGRFGICMERLYGETLLEQMMNGDASKVGFVLGTLQKAYHRICASQLQDMTDVLAWQIRQENGLGAFEQETLVRRMLRLPKCDKLVHMDYHCANVMHTKTGVKIIDWSGACAGDPSADAARTLLTLGRGVYPIDADHVLCAKLDAARSACLKGYLEAFGGDRDAIRAWTPLIAAARLYCCPQQERQVNMQIVREALAHI